MMNPNFLLNMPKLPALMAEDCNVPALRDIRAHEFRRPSRIRALLRRIARR